MFNVESAGVVNVSFWNSADLLEGAASANLAFDYSGGGDRGVSCRHVKLPAEKFKKGSAVVKAEASFPGEDYQILSFKSVRLINLRPLVLVQTDKPDYRPEQAVKFRVLALDYQLRPSSVVKELSEVWVSDPSGSRLEQWKGVELRKGMAQLEYQLTEEPTLGTWKVRTYK